MQVRCGRAPGGLGAGCALWARCGWAVGGPLARCGSDVGGGWVVAWLGGGLVGRWGSGKWAAHVVTHVHGSKRLGALVN